MKALLFNIHDIILLLCTGAYLLLASLGWADIGRSRDQKIAWVAFFIINGLIASYTLLYWSTTLRDRVFEAFAYIYPLLIAIHLLVGPALLGVVKTSRTVTLAWKRHYIWHFSPAILALGYLFAVCFRFDHATQRELFIDLKLYSQPGIYYQTFVTLQKLIPWGYGIAALLSVLRYTRSSGPQDSESRPTLLLVACFMTIWTWETLTHFIGRAFPGDLSDLLGISSNYLKFTVALVLLVIELRAYQANSPQRFIKGVVPNSPASAAPLEQGHIKAVVDAMEQQQVFLNSQLTLERFAEQVKLSPRDVSAVINRKFQQNFHEYINSYRIEVAKKLLRESTNEQQSISDIAHAAGFNSKATFNRFFKKFVLSTPSEYRKKHQKNHVI